MKETSLTEKEVDAVLPIIAAAWYFVVTAGRAIAQPSIKVPVKDIAAEIRGILLRK